MGVSISRQLQRPQGALICKWVPPMWHIRTQPI